MCTFRCLVGHVCETCGPVTRKTVWTMVDVSQVMIDHTIICKIHVSRLTTLVRNEVNCTCRCTKILVFLSMKLELLVSPSKDFFLFPFSDCPKTENRDPPFCHVFDVSDTPKNPITSVVVTGFLLDFLVSFWSKTKIETHLPLWMWGFMANTRTK